MIQRIYLILLLVLGLNGTISAQQLIKGTIKDAETGEAIPFASVVYKGHNQAVISDIDGVYSIRRHLGWKITFSAVGYQSQEITVTSETKNELDIALKSDKMQLAEVTVTTKRSRYSRKNNPAVELMKKVIAAKKLSDLSNHDYYQYDKYEKLTLAANDLTPKRLEEKPFSSTPWLMDQVETCKYNNKKILPISVDETVSQIVYRKSPQSKKTYIKGEQSSGLNDLFQTGDILNVVLKEVFTNVDLYDDQIRLVQYPFTSRSTAIVVYTCISCPTTKWISVSEVISTS